MGDAWVERCVCRHAAACESLANERARAHPEDPSPHTSDGQTTSVAHEGAGDEGLIL